MSPTRKRVFGPLTLAVIVIGALVSLYFLIELADPTMARWSREWLLNRRLQSSSVGERLNALGAVDEEDASFSRTTLLGATRDPEVDVRLAACRRLSNRGLESQPILRVLESDAADAIAEARAEVAEILGIIAHREGMEARLTVVGPPREATPIVRCRDTLLRLLRDPAIRVRVAAATALGNTPPDSETSLALGESALDPDQDLRMAVAGSLLKLNGRDDPKAVALLCGLVTEPEPIADRAGLVSLLNQAGEASQRRVIAALVEFLKRADPLILPELISDLSEVSPKAGLAVPALDDFLDHPDSVVRAAAALTLAMLEEKPSPRALKALVRMITDAELTGERRSEALNRLQELAPGMLSEATPELVRQLGDANVIVRRSAIELLAPILEDRPAVLPGASSGK